MKRNTIIVVLAFLWFYLSGCSQDIKVIAEPPTPLAYESYVKDELFAYSDYGLNDGIYYIDFFDNLKLMYWDGESEAPLFLSHTAFADDKPSNINDGISFNKYIEQIVLSNIVVNNNYVYSLYEYRSIDGQIKYTLNRFDQYGQNKTTIIEFDEAPYSFKIIDGLFYISFVDSQSSKLVIYDGKKEVEVLDIGLDSLDFLPSEEHIYYYSYDVLGNSIVKRLNLSSGVIEELLYRDILVFQSDDAHMSTYSLSAYANEVDHPEDIELMGHLYDLQSNEEIFSIAYEMINYFDDTYIYTSQVRDKQSYRIYNYDGELVKEIVPSDSLEVQTTVSNVFWQTDFSQIIRIFKGNIIARSSDGYIACNIESGQCNELQADQ